MQTIGILAVLFLSGTLGYVRAKRKGLMMPIRRTHIDNWQDRSKYYEHLLRR